MSNFSPDEISHYQRHLGLDKIGESGQEKLQQSSILIVGVGGLGCPALQYLVAAGVGRIGIIDSDLVELSNLQRQILFTYDDIGKYKAETAKNKISRLNPHIKIEYFNDRLCAENIEERLEEYSIILDGSDNFETKYLLNDASVLFNKVLIYGSIFEFSAQVSVFNYNNGPTYRCLFPEPPSANALPPCAESGVLGVLPGIVGSIQANEAIKVITGIGDTLSGKLLLFDALSLKTQFIQVNLRPESRNITSLAPINLKCATSKDEDLGIQEIDPLTMIAMNESGKTDLIIDVRELWERELSKISPSIHIPLAHFEQPEKIEFPELISSSSHIILYCKAGVRSRMACKSLEAIGYKNLYNLSGGITEWGNTLNSQGLYQ